MQREIEEKGDSVRAWREREESAQRRVSELEEQLKEVRQALET